MTPVFWLGKADLEAHIDAGADQKHFQHEVVEGLDEECPERSTRRHFLHVRPEVLHANI